MEKFDAPIMLVYEDESQAMPRPFRLASPLLHPLVLLFLFNSQNLLRRRVFLLIDPKGFVCLFRKHLISEGDIKLSSKVN